MTDYALSLHSLDTPGQTLYTTDAIQSLNYAFNINDVTELQIKLPSKTQFPVGIIGRTTTCKLWRRPRNLRSFYIEGDTEWLLTKYDRKISRDGEEVVLTFAHPNVILQRRLIAYKQETLYADKTDANLNTAQTPYLVLAYIDENIGHLCQDVTRIIPDLERIIHAGPVSEDLRECSAPWRNLLTTLQELSSYQEDGVTRYYFELRVIDGQPVFRMAPYYLGSDLSETVTFSQNFGNLGEIQITEDYGREINVCYAGGAGSGLLQYVDIVYNKIPNPMLRSEGFESMGDIDVDAVLEDHGLRYLARNRARRLLRAKVQDTGAFLYGTSYRHGDLVSLAVNGQAYKCHIYAVSVTVEERGETVDIYLEAEQPL